MNVLWNRINLEISEFSQSLNIEFFSCKILYCHVQCHDCTLTFIQQVWECRLDPRTKFRAKKDFLQWQTKGGGGEPITYGIRLKDSETATQVGTCRRTSIMSCDNHVIWYYVRGILLLQLNDRITEVLNAMMSKPPEVL